MGSTQAVRLARYALMALTVSHVVVHGLGCSDSHEESTGVPDTVVLAGAVSDETYAAVAGLTPAKDAKAGALIAPLDMTVLQPGAALNVEWSAATARVAPRDPPRRRSRLLDGERTAFAHGTPFTGIAYLVTFAAPSGKVVEVLTDKTSWPADQASLDKLRAVGGPVTVSLTSATVQKNAVISGPFLSPSVVSLTVK